MIIIDKARWQIDGGVPEDSVVSHFQAVFSWLCKHDMLSDEGREEFDDGIDCSASLNEDLVTSEALVFLENCYDDFLKTIEGMGMYGSDSVIDVLDNIYSTYIDVRNNP
ncbi:MAG: hypothetical protein LBD25_02740 [Coriobacteriales bacterium]|nr:hypothetical protein [Coriobacteriales bacterium]